MEKRLNVKSEVTESYVRRNRTVPREPGARFFLPILLTLFEIGFITVYAVFGDSELKFDQDIKHYSSIFLILFLLTGV